jgi:hypothetical protein
MVTVQRLRGELKTITKSINAKNVETNGQNTKRRNEKFSQKSPRNKAFFHFTTQF